MNKFKKLSSFLSIVLALSVVLGNFSLPVLAYEKDGINLGQFLTKTTPYNVGTDLNKISSPSNEAKSLPLSSSITKTGKTGLEKSQQIVAPQKNYVEGEILVKYKNNKINLDTSSGRAAALNFISSKSLENKEDIIKANISVLKIKDSKTVEQKIAELKNDPNIEYVQPNFQYYPLSIDTNDTYKDLLWGLDNTGQSVNGISGTNDADIDAPEAWAINEGTNSSAIVAVIDSGVAYNHPDLAGNLWDGSSCKDENGNALGGCNHGYDYEDSDKIPLPTTSSHGTHIAGTIVAVKNNSKGIIGVAPNVKIMALKSSLTTADNVKSINFAKQNGAKVINASWGTYSTSGGYYDIAMYNAIKDFSGLFVVAAGNADYNHDDGIDTHKSYPDGFKITTPIGPGLNNIIVVAATDQNDALATFSDYGAISVDVGAPGTNIYSTFADTTILDETFEEVTPPDVPSGWVKGGTNNNWGTYNFNDGFWNKVLYGDLALLYANNTNSTITSLTYNLGGNTSGATISFLTACDTEYTTTDWRDYMVLEYSSDGTSFSPYLPWDEAFLDFLNGDSNPSGGAGYYFENLSIPSQYLSSNFKFRFRWVTNASDNNYDGCRIDYITITKYSDGSDEKYEYMDGTSVAVPHVAGLAGLIWGYKPGLTYFQVKDTILSTGDDKASLSGKTVTGKRINAYNALNSIDVTIPTLSEVIPVPTPTNDNTPDYTFSSDEAGTISYDGGCTSSTTEAIAGDNTISFNELMDGTYASCTIAVTDASDNTSDPLLVSPFTIDTVIPVITLTGSSTVNLYVGDSYTDTGATALDDVDGDLTASIVVGGDTVDTTTLGTYIITYNVLDAAGNSADEVTRTIIVSEAPDTIPPIITAPADQTFEATGVSTTPILVEATATDNVDPNPFITYDPHSFSVGTTSVTWTATDASGNKATATSNVIITDTTAPVITGIPTDITEEVDFGESGVIVSYTVPTATDLVDGSVAATCTPASGSTFPLGDTTVTCTATDAAGNTATSTFKVTVVVDTTPPIITLLGDNPITIGVGTTYNDAGATASDNHDGNITGNMVIVNPVNSNTIGIYTVTYNVTDSSGNPATEVTRTVNVVDTTPPVITLLGENPITIPVNTVYDDAGATASDNYDGVITNNIVTVNSVDTNTIGTYYVTYNVTDSSSNPAIEIIRTVNVVDVSTPIISLLGNNPLTIEVGSVYSDAGATATDDVDGDISGNIVVVNNVNSNILGTYTVTYNVSDSSGNHAPEAIRTVNVVDTTAPVIVLLGDNPASVEVGYEYNDAGATANDNYDGDISSDIIAVSNVDYHTAGTYSVTYNVTDSSDNSAEQVSRTVVVGPDLTPPVITLNGGNVSIQQGTTYTDAGATASDIADGNITSQIVTTGSVDTATLGTYSITYNVSDAAGNSAVEVIRTVNVVAAPVTFTLTYTAGANGSITGISPQTVNSGSDGTSIAAVPASGYHFVSWSDNSTTNPRTDTNVTGDISVTANFAVNQTSSGGGSSVTSYTITASAGTNGLISPAGSTSVTSGGSQIYTITPNAGYKVADVLVDNVSKGSITTYTFSNVSTSHTISVTFVAGTQSVKSGDANGDSKVDKYDFSLMMANWGKTGTNACDFNSDGKVDKYDFALLMSKWGL